MIEIVKTAVMAVVILCGIIAIPIAITIYSYIFLTGYKIIKSILKEKKEKKNKE